MAWLPWDGARTALFFPYSDLQGKSKNLFGTRFTDSVLLGQGCFPSPLNYGYGRGVMLRCSWRRLVPSYTVVNIHRASKKQSRYYSVLQGLADVDIRASVAR